MNETWILKQNKSQKLDVAQMCFWATQRASLGYVTKQSLIREKYQFTIIVEEIDG